ncbi:hypothetical protein [Enhygromyxa salina]|uniref:Lipoprotein n=1 Tax=Enhygromyxa salina TaxID=215803 RepID=A0A2S9Y3J0_9BACT|nr:hypothetical protein [Enhygromyxa salina]PRP99673.1 hypothetical protein ENSA7_63130 [Enhygromyxa salina]
MKLLSRTNAALCAAISLSSLIGCSVGSDDELGPDSQLRALGQHEGTVADGIIVNGGGYDGSCLLYVVRADYSYLALAVERHFDDGPPYCGAVESYLDRRDVIVSWDPADLSPIADQSFVQTVSETYDRPRHRQVEYVWLDGPLSAQFWGTVYGAIDQRSVAGLGDTCAYYLETDEGTAYALLEPEDMFGACPKLDQVAANSTIRIALDDLTEVEDPALVDALADTFFSGGAEHYVFVNAVPAPF